MTSPDSSPEPLADKLAASGIVDDDRGVALLLGIEASAPTRPEPKAEAELEAEVEPKALSEGDAGGEGGEVADGEAAEELVDVEVPDGEADAVAETTANAAGAPDAVGAENEVAEGVAPESGASEPTAPETIVPGVVAIDAVPADAVVPVGKRPEDRVKDIERFTGHKVQLRVFEGPLDLLLYLVRAHRYDVADIPISEVTSQFIDFIVLMDELDLEYAGDFLVTAATLMQIKSRMLLPKHESLNEEELENPDENDPRTELVQRLLEYQKYQEAAGALKEMREEREHQFTRPPILDPAVAAAQKAAEEAGETIDPFSAGVLLKDVSTFDLLRALQKVLDRQKEKPVATIRRDPFTLSERVRELGKRIAIATEGISFTDLCDDCQSRLEIVITFLGILELIARKRIVAAQHVLFDEIWVQTRPREAGIAPLS
jgi:segregation and condensation protein A